MDNRALALRASAWKMEQAAAETRQQMQGRLASMRANCSCVFLLSMWLALSGVLGVFRGGSFEKHAFYLAMHTRLAETLEPVVIGLAIAVPIHWAARYFEHRLDRISVEMSLGASQTIGDFKKLPFGSSAAPDVSLKT